MKSQTSFIFKKEKHAKQIQSKTNIFFFFLQFFEKVCNFFTTTIFFWEIGTQCFCLIQKKRKFKSWRHFDRLLRTLWMLRFAPHRPFHSIRRMMSTRRLCSAPGFLSSLVDDLFFFLFCCKYFRDDRVFGMFRKVFSCGNDKMLLLLLVV